MDPSSPIGDLIGASVLTTGPPGKSLARSPKKQNYSQVVSKTVKSQESNYPESAFLN